MIRFEANIRGEAVFASGKAAEKFANGLPFSVMIANGRGEIFFKKIEGAWHERLMTVDKCFGVMKSKFRKLKI